MFKAKKGIFWGVIERLIEIFFPFIVRTIFIYTLGIEYTGLNSLFTSILSVLSLSELGIGTSLVFSMYEPIEKKDNEKVCALLNLYKKSYFVIGTIIFAFGLLLMPFLKYLINGDIPSDINLQILFFLYIINTSIGYFVGSYRISLITASRDISIKNKIGCLVSCVKYVLQIIVLLILKNYYAYIICLPLCTLLNNILIVIITKIKYKNYNPKGTIPKDDLKKITKNIGGLIFEKIGLVVLTSVDSIVISSFLGLKILGIYNGYYYVITALIGFFSVIAGTIVPFIGNLMIKKNNIELYGVFKNLHFLYIWIVCFSVCGLVCLYQPFITLWQGKENTLEFGIVICLSIYFYCHKMSDICYIFKEANGLWWQGKFVPLIAAILNLVINLILVNFIGLYGIIISTIISLVLVYAPYGSYVLFKYYFKDKSKWFKYLLTTFKYFVITALTAGITYSLCLFNLKNLWVELIAKGFIVLIISNLLFFLFNVFSKDFKSNLLFIKNIIKRKN